MPLSEATKAYLRERDIKTIIGTLRDTNKTDEEMFTYLKKKYNATWDEFQRLKEETEHPVPEEH